MEFFYNCTTCVFGRKDADVRVIYDDTKMCCFSHSVLLPSGVGSKDLICCRYEPQDPRATELLRHVKNFPQGELWSFTGYLPSKKFIDIAELSPINPDCSVPPR